LRRYRDVWPGAPGLTRLPGNGGTVHPWEPVVIGMRDREIVIQTESLSKRYGRVLALDGLSLDVRAGEVLGFLGPNGAGKTTTLRLLMAICGRPRVRRGCTAWTAGGTVSRSTPGPGTCPVTYVCGRG
jgi:ABC-type iron transport system FetAB ATPase subunit